MHLRLYFALCRSLLVQKLSVVIIRLACRESILTMHPLLPDSELVDKRALEYLKLSVCGWAGLDGVGSTGAQQTLKNISFRALGHHGTWMPLWNRVGQTGGGVNMPKEILAEPSASVDSDLGTSWYDNAPDVEIESACLRLSAPLANTTLWEQAAPLSHLPNDTITAVRES